MIKAFCERLKELRLENGLSTSKLGEALKVTHATISRWENGKISPTIDNLYNIALYFKASADYLIGLEN